MADKSTVTSRRVANVRGQIERAHDRVQRTLIGQVWERMLEIEFIDRSVALAGKAFVSFFPLVIVVAAFAPERIRASIFNTLYHRLGIQGHALAVARQAFSSADDVRRATGFLGLALTFFFASSFTTALHRVYTRAWRRPPGGRPGSKYTRGPAWLLAILAYMALMGAIRAVLGDGPGLGAFFVVALASSIGFWCFTTWFMLMGNVQWRACIASGIVTAVAMGGYAISASIWMPNVVTRNESQFGFFGVALALVTWFSGAAICVVVGACAGAVFAEDQGPVGALLRGPGGALLVEGAAPPLPPPTRDLTLRDAFRTAEEDAPLPE